MPGTRFTKKLVTLSIYLPYVTETDFLPFSCLTALMKTYSYSLMMMSSNGNIFRVTGHLCGKFTVPGEFPTQRPVTRSFDVHFDLRPNKRLSKQSWGWWFETPSRPLWRHRNVFSIVYRHWNDTWNPSPLKSGTRLTYRANIKIVHELETWYQQSWH